MPDFDTLSPEEQRKILLNLILEHCPNALLEGDTLHYTGQALHVALEFGQIHSRENRFSAQLIFILKHDWFDEELVESCASLGNSLEDAMKACTAEFSESVLKSVLYSLENPASETIVSEIIGKKYKFHVPEQHLVLHKGKGKNLDPWETVKDKIPEYLGTKRVYWIKLFSADMGEKQFCEARINGIVYPDLTDLLYQELLSRTDRQVSINKLFIVLIQDAETYEPCPFTKQNVGDLTFLALDKMTDIKEESSRNKVFQEIAKFCPDYSIAVELIAFLPEIISQAVVNYRDNDSLIPVFDYGKPEHELKKSQVRSYGYMTDATEQYLRKSKPSREEIENLLRISGKFETISRALQDEGIKIEDLRLSPLVYFVSKNYRVW
ncbi:MAG: hypothetical protein IJJ69_08355 [Oscillospiraceae bacterium]|nr:hypothetical protein [Oscillospiraceae bacterium]